MAVKSLHVPTLDGLRAVAIVLVLWQHAGILFGVRGLDSELRFWQASRSGWWGVDLFFVLSGFLITRILFRGGAAPGAMATFWKRRAARTLPLLYVYLVAAATYGFGGGYAVFDQPWLAYVTHTTNLHVARNDFGLPIFGMLWSLGVEEQFYLVWPLITRWLRGHVAHVCLGLIMVAPVLRWIVYNVSDSYAAFHVLPFCRVDTLAMGAILATWIERPSTWRTVARIGRFALAGALAILLLVTVWAPGPWPMGRFEEIWIVFGYSLVGVSCAIVVVVAAQSGPIATLLLANPVARYVGRISYGMYLWHCLLALIVIALPWEAGASLSITVWVAVVVAVASASYFGIERKWLGQAVPPASVAAA